MTNTKDLWCKLSTFRSCLRWTVHVIIIFCPYFQCLFWPVGVAGVCWGSWCVVLAQSMCGGYDRSWATPGDTMAVTNTSSYYTWQALVFGVWLSVQCWDQQLSLLSLCTVREHNESTKQRRTWLHVCDFRQRTCPCCRQRRTWPRLEVGASGKGVSNTVSISPLSH